MGGSCVDSSSSSVTSRTMDTRYSVSEMSVFLRCQRMDSLFGDSIAWTVTDR